jgi:lipopolysaccharide export system ATP-binding protein
VRRDTDPASRAALTADSLSVRLGGALVLREVTLEVAPGEVLGIFGPSGAGKSTLFRALAGEERLEAGRVLLDGGDVTSLPLWQRARRGLGYLPQTPSVLLDLTVLQNLDTFRRLAARGGRSPAPREVAAELGLDARLDVRASALSGGERRRLELARALSASPRVLLCDEPFAAIDPRGTARAGARLRKLADEGTAVIIADHHVTEALEICDRAALLLDGQLAVVGTPDEFCRDALVRRHYATK